MSDFPETPVFPFGNVMVSTFGWESLGCMPIIGGGVSSNTWPTANKAIYVPFRLSAPFTFNSISTPLGTSSGNLDLGVYAADGTRITSKGSTAAVANVNTLSVSSTTIGPGLFYLAMAADNTTLAVYGYKLTATAATGLIRAVGVCEQTTAFALPSTATFAAFTGTLIPIIGITNRSVV